MSMSNFTRMAMMRRNGNTRNAYGTGGSNVQNMRNAYGAENRGGGMTNAYNAYGAYNGNPSGGNIENRRDSRGRYAPRNDGGYSDGGSMRMGHDEGWVVQPVHQEMGYRMNEDGGRMIGFDGGMENQMRMGHGQKKGMEQMQMGGSEGHEGSHKLDQRTAVEWVNKMENSDGSRGEHFTMEQTERVRKNKGLECDPIEFWVAMNAMWSDGAATARKYNVDKIEYWADRAKEFIMDKDAGPGKMAKYYKYIVKHE